MENSSGLKTATSRRPRFTTYEKDIGVQSRSLVPLLVPLSWFRLTRPPRSSRRLGVRLGTQGAGETSPAPDMLFPERQVASDSTKTTCPSTERDRVFSRHRGNNLPSSSHLAGKLVSPPSEILPNRTPAATLSARSRKCLIVANLVVSLLQIRDSPGSSAGRVPTSRLPGDRTHPRTSAGSIARGGRTGRRWPPPR